MLLNKYNLHKVVLRYFSVKSKWFSNWLVTFWRIFTTSFNFQFFFRFYLFTFSHLLDDPKMGLRNSTENWKIVRCPEVLWIAIKIVNGMRWNHSWQLFQLSRQNHFCFVLENFRSNKILIQSKTQILGLLWANSW